MLPSSNAGKEIHYASDLNGLDKGTKSLTLSSTVLKQIKSWPPLEKLQSVTIKHDLSFDTSLKLWIDVSDEAALEAVRSGVMETLNEDVMESRSESGLCELRTGVPETTEIRLQGRFTAVQNIVDPRDALVFIKVWQNDYTYNVRSQRLEEFTMRCVRDVIIHWTTDWENKVWDDAAIVTDF